MSEATGNATQGQDPKWQVYADLYPVLYAAETPVSSAYVTASMVSAVYADALKGLRGKDVLDIGCGYGTTTVALSNFQPRKIVATDNAQGMLDLMKRVMIDDEDLDAWMKSNGAEEILGDLYEQTLLHLKKRRADFQDGIFLRNGGELVIRNVPILDLPTDLGSFDVVVGNNVAHWPINQRRASLKKENTNLDDSSVRQMAIIETFGAVARSLKSGGVAILMEPKDFFSDDANPARESDLESHTFVGKHLFIGFHTIFNRLLKENYGIDRAVPTTSGLFSSSELPSICKKSGLRLLRVAHHEYAWQCDPVNALYVRLPLVLGSINIPFADKIKLGRMTMDEFSRFVKPEDYAFPMQVQYFYICAKKI